MLPSCCAVCLQYGLLTYTRSLVLINCISTDQLDFSKKVDRLRCPRNMRGDINGNFINGFWLIVISANFSTAQSWWSLTGFGVVCFGVCRQHSVREDWKWRLDKRRGQSGPGWTVPAEQTDPPVSAAEQKRGGGSAAGPHLSSVLREDVWGAEAVSFDIWLKQMSTCLLFFTTHKHCSCYFDLIINRKPELLKGVYNMGFNRPSRIQENALPMMLAQPWVHFDTSDQFINGENFYSKVIKSVIKQKYKIFAGSGFWNVRICCSSLHYIIKMLCLCILNYQLDSEQLDIALHSNLNCQQFW